MGMVAGDGGGGENGDGSSGEVSVVTVVVMVSAVRSRQRPQHARQHEVMKDLTKSPNLEKFLWSGGCR